MCYVPVPQWPRVAQSEIANIVKAIMEVIKQYATPRLFPLSASLSVLKFTVCLSINVCNDRYTELKTAIEKAMAERKEEEEEDYEEGESDIDDDDDIEQSEYLSLLPSPFLLALSQIVIISFATSLN